MIKSDDIITYHHAHDLKELGFDENSMLFYVNRNYLALDVNFRGNDDEDIIYAPTYEQAFEWFRINHNLCGYIKPFRNYDHKVGYLWCIFEMEEQRASTMHKFYCDARYECLSKLIEYVKEKNKKSLDRETA